MADALRPADATVRTISISLNAADVFCCRRRDLPSHSTLDSTTESSISESAPRLPLRYVVANYRFSQTITNQAIFRMSSGVCNLFREYLNGQGFIEIHTPKLGAAATESGSSVFKVSYFKGSFSLISSPS